MPVPRWLDGYHAASLPGRARARRWRLLVDLFPEIAEMRVLDLGGTPSFWESVAPRPKSVVILNLLALPSGISWVEPLVGDACDPPTELTRQEFDFVFSNSVLEHVGGYDRRRQMAMTIQDFKLPYWIQTPNRHFPIEPHWVFPFAQFLPTSCQAALGRWWPLSYVRAASWQEATETALGIELVDRAELMELFPEADILAELFGGMSKSLIAVHTVAT